MLNLEAENSREVRRRSDKAFSALYGRHYASIYSFAFARLGNRADAEDAVQETFTAVFESLGSFEGKASLRGWIYGIARNVVNSHIRRSKSDSRRLSKAEVYVTRSETSLDLCGPEQALSLRRCAAALEAQMKEISDWQAEAFEMRHFKDCAIGEIADRVDRSNYSVRCSLYRVKQRVYDAMSPQETSLG